MDRDLTQHDKDISLSVRQQKSNAQFLQTLTLIKTARISCMFSRFNVQR